MSVQEEEIRSAHFLPNLVAYHVIEAGEVESECPSNIALVKYWGKKEVQIPANSSLSFTLSESKTITKLAYQPKAEEGYDVKIFLDGVEKPAFLDKILSFFERVQPFLPFLQSYSFQIHTKNTFPHSAGIASSASGIGALALCLLQMEEKISGEKPREEFLKKASFLARLGSGSACRSIYKGLVFWGENPKIAHANKRFAIPYPYKVHEVFKDFRDTILLIDQTEKSVNSTAGHGLMDEHPFAEGRYAMAEENIVNLIPILESGDLEAFGKIVEREALTLHALMLSSPSPYLLLRPNTLAAIQKIWTYRQATGAPLYFTIDAGANLHLLYPGSEESGIMSFIKSDLQDLCLDGKFIEDRVNF